LLDGEMQKSAPLTHDWIADYAAGWMPPAPRRRSAASAGATSAPHDLIRPNAMQAGALESIAALRESGERRGLVISATGTGKTILAALDVRAADPKRVLFVAHREQILDRATAEFARVLSAPADQFGKLAGASRDIDRRYVFSTIQTLSRLEVLSSLDPDAFDYILI